MKKVVTRGDRIAMVALVMLGWLAPRAWSLDGARIVFAGTAAGADGTPNIYITIPDGEALEQLTFQAGAKSGWSLHPDWSPDGRQIAFSSNRNRVGSRIYVMNADATNRSPMAKTTGTVTPFPPGHLVGPQLRSRPRDGQPCTPSTSLTFRAVLTHG